MISEVFTILIYAQTTVNARHIFIDISVTMSQRKVITICMDSYRLTLYISSVVYILASRGPILKFYRGAHVRHVFIQILRKFKMTKIFSCRHVPGLG